MNRVQLRSGSGTVLRRMAAYAVIVLALHSTISSTCTYGHSTNTHQILMDYAIQKAKDGLGLPISGSMSSRGTAWTRMWEGAEQEDITWDILGESVRYKQHGFNPLSNGGFVGFGTARDRSKSIWDDRMAPYFADDYLNQAETSSVWGGAWQQLGRISHLTQDMSILTVPLA